MSEHRDDLETLAPPSPAGSRTGFVFSVPSQQCRVSSICPTVDSRVFAASAAAGDSVEESKRASNEGGEEAVAEEDFSSPSLNNTRMEMEDERLDLNSVLSGTMEEDDATVKQEDGNAVSVKNLSRLFEENDGRAITAAPKPMRPPLAPGRANLKTEEGTAPAAKNEDGKLLSVYLRIRPPVSAEGKEGVDGSISTIEVLPDSNVDGVPSTIRTYPPLTSNAAKVVRTGSKLVKMSASKSLNEEGRSSEEGEVLGVKEYSYSGVFGPSSTQEEIYETIGAPLVDGLFPEEKSGELGESALLFTLGVTNAGKTHTVMGTGFEKKKKSYKIDSHSTPHKDWGIIPRSLHHILSRVNIQNESSGPKLQLFMSYLEIYNEQIYDLLPVKTKQSKRPILGPEALKLRESRRGRIFVRGLARHPVSNVQQGLDLAEEAKKNRHTASNNINAASSRSHSICQFEIAYYRGPSGGSGKSADSDAEASEYETDDDSSVSSAGSKKGRQSTIIWIVDLAGSERSKRTGAISHTRHQKEAALINASLMNLMRCLREMLNQQGPKKRGPKQGAGVVPFRESKLTHMFMNHLTGPSASRTSMIVNVNPAADDFDETQHVLSYATTARSVKVSMVDYNKKHRILAKESNVKLSPVKRIKELVKKFSPQKRKGTDLNDSKPISKRQRSNTNALKRPGAPGAIKKILPARPASGRSQRNEIDEVEKLREENFSLKITIDDLEQQLADCEAEVRKEVVEIMTEQLEESKEWYESRIESLKQQLKNVHTSTSKQVKSDSDAQSRVNELYERINECEEEMTRMREEYEAEKTEDLLNLTNLQVAELEANALAHEDELRAEREEKNKLLAENGALKHQAEEMRASHDALLAKYNELLVERERDSPDTFDSIDPEPTGELSSPSYHKLPRERCSNVASTSASVDIKSPKTKGKKWGFLRSPAKVAAGQRDENRSPLEKENRD